MSLSIHVKNIVYKQRNKSYEAFSNGKSIGVKHIEPYSIMKLLIKVLLVIFIRHNIAADYYLTAFKMSKKSIMLMNDRLRINYLFMKNIYTKIM